MVNYKCLRCNYITDRKSNFINHLSRKKLCIPTIKNISVNKILIHYNIQSDNIQCANKQSENKQVKVSEILICDGCNKTFKRKTNFERHKISCSKCTDINNDKYTNSIEKQNDLLINKVEEMLNKMSIMEEELRIIKEQPNINNNFNKIEANIQINNFGNENFDYINDKVFKNLLSTPLSAIPKLIELKYFNPYHPENHNIKITNIHDKFAKIYKDNKWLISHKKDIIQDLVDNGYADFEEFRDLNEEEFTFKIKEKYKKLENYYLNNPETLYKKSEISIINGSTV
jgi:hypothetical protein